MNNKQSLPPFYCFLFSTFWTFIWDFKKSFELMKLNLLPKWRLKWSTFTDFILCFKANDEYLLSFLLLLFLYFSRYLQKIDEYTQNSTTELDLIHIVRLLLIVFVKDQIFYILSIKISDKYYWQERMNILYTENFHFID